METRANYILVGFFSLLMMLGILLTISWLNKGGKDSDQHDFDISFNESIKGLNIGSPVLFSGIRVGQVKQIKISDSVPGSVKVRVAINSDTPIRENSMARLELLGLTGGSVISITGGTASSPLLPYDPNIVRAIKAQRSPFDAVLNDIPNTLAMTNSVLNNIDGMVTKKNQQNLATILQSVAILSSALADKADTIEALITDTKVTMSEARKVMESVSKVSARVDVLVNKVSPSVERLTTESFPQMNSLIMQSKELITKLKNISEKLSDTPMQYLLGKPVRQYEP